MKVTTTRGDVEIERLEVRDIVTLAENARVIATEWRLAGELVRRDVCALVLRPLLMGARDGE